METALTKRRLSRSGARLDDLYRAHADAVFRQCMRFAAGDRGWALDRAHDTYVTLAENLPTLDPHLDDAAMLRWLSRVAINHCLMGLRRRRLWRQRAHTVHAFFVGLVRARTRDPESELGVQRAMLRVERALGGLEDKERAVLTLLYLDDRSQQEVADLLELSKGYVSKLHQRGLTHLRERGFADLFPVVGGGDVGA